MKAAYNVLFLKLVTRQDDKQNHSYFVSTVYLFIPEYIQRSETSGYQKQSPITSHFWEVEIPHSFVQSQAAAMACEGVGGDSARWAYCRYSVAVWPLTTPGKDYNGPTERRRGR